MNNKVQKNQNAISVLSFALEFPLPLGNERLDKITALRGCPVYSTWYMNILYRPAQAYCVHKVKWTVW